MFVTQYCNKYLISSKFPCISIILWPVIKIILWRGVVLIKYLPSMIYGDLRIVNVSYIQESDE